MYIKKRVTLPLMGVTALLLSGFGWNFSGGGCTEALELAKQLPGIQDERIRSVQEARIVELCPDGAAAQYVAGRQAERSGALMRQSAPTGVPCRTSLPLRWLAVASESCISSGGCWMRRLSN